VYHLLILSELMPPNWAGLIIIAYFVALPIPYFSGIINAL
jgi:hypothetical protein